MVPSVVMLPSCSAIHRSTAVVFAPLTQEDIQRFGGLIGTNPSPRRSRGLDPRNGSLEQNQTDRKHDRSGQNTDLGDSHGRSWRTSNRKPAPASKRSTPGPAEVLGASSPAHFFFAAASSCLSVSSRVKSRYWSVWFSRVRMGTSVASVAGEEAGDADGLQADAGVVVAGQRLEPVEGVRHPVAPGDQDLHAGGSGLRIGGLEHLLRATRRSPRCAAGGPRGLPAGGDHSRGRRSRSSIQFSVASMTSFESRPESSIRAR